VARLRALALSTGIMAMEIDRRAREQRQLDLTRPPQTSDAEPISPSALLSPTSTWASIAPFTANRSETMAQIDVFPLAGRVLAASVHTAGRDWHASATSFANEASPALRGSADVLRAAVRELSERAAAASDEADEISRDLAVGQRLGVKRVVDVIEKMLRRRRRRFRWVRRAGWLAVEWVLVGFMWYVWFVVMIARVLLGVGRGLVKGARWLLWL
jgi:hypothetical protein